MGLFDKIKDGAKAAAEKAGDVAKKAAEQTKEAINQSKYNIQQFKEESEALKAPVEGAIIRYEVVYGGGLAKYPKAKSGAIGLNVMNDSFILKKTIGSKDWFEDFEIPYDSIQSFKIVKRQAGNWEMMLSSDAASARATEVENVLAITYLDESGIETLLRLEMLTGLTVYNQAKTCQDMLDLLRQNKILNRLNKENSTSNNQPSSIDEVKKLKDLLDAGIITQEEFDIKKKQLLGL